MIEIDGISYLTVDEVCARLAVKPATLYTYVSRGVLHSYKQGIKRQRLYRADEVDALLVLRPRIKELPQSLIEQPALAAPADTAELPEADRWIGDH